jgi:hypothetical protein
MPQRDEIVNNATQLLTDLLEFFQSRTSSVNFEGSDKNIFAVILMVKIQNICQGIYVTHEKKHLMPLEILLRSLIENVCLLKKHIDDPDFLNKYMDYEKYHQELMRLKTLRKIGDKSVPNIDELIKELKEKSKSIPRISSTEIISDSGLGKEFIVCFFNFSESVHSNFNDIKRYIKQDSDGTLSINAFPIMGSQYDLIARLLTACHSIIITLETTQYLFKLSIIDNISNFKKLFNSIDHELRLLMENNK